MNILALGGCGNMGREVMRTLLLEKEKIDRVTVADINLSSAEKFVDILNDSRVDALKVDILNKSQLKDALKGYDLVINTIGPFYRYAIPVMRAAIETKVNYIDICDDIEPTIESLKLEKEANDAGIFLIVGMGASPGLTNLLAKDLAQSLDQVDEIITAWVVGEDTREEEGEGLSEGIGSLEHGFHMAIGQIPTFRNGKQIKIPGYRDGLKFPFPEPLGEYTCYHVAHPEVITLPKYVEGVRTVSNLGASYPEFINYVFQNYIKDIEDGKHTLQSAISEIITYVEEYTPPNNKKNNEKELSLSGLYISAIGTKDGERGQNIFTICSNNPVCVSTSQTLSCAVFHLAQGHPIEAGVYPPEGIFNISDILEISAKYDLEFSRDIEKDVVTGWNQNILSVEKK
jgi:saccharopine dehydrogenase (NAD+, L-lysine-forming)